MSVQYASIAQSNARDGRGTYGTERAESSACWRFCTHASAAKVTATGRSRMIPTTAPLAKSCWPITSLKMSVASMLKLPPITFGMPKSLIAYVNTTIAALMSPYFAPGTVIVQNLRRVDVPSASAAS